MVRLDVADGGVDTLRGEFGLDMIDRGSVGHSKPVRSVHRQMKNSRRRKPSPVPARDRPVALSSQGSAQGAPVDPTETGIGRRVSHSQGSARAATRR